MCKVVGFVLLSLVSLGNMKKNPVYYDTMELIENAGYPAQKHRVVTSDGYILTLHRVPHGRNSTSSGQPVLLQHGFLMDSSHFVFSGNRSLAFILANEGYDVWIGNARGNKYSRSHISLTTKDSKFWNFSYHEMGIYDLPAVLSYIGNYTSKTGEILYIGHSLGCTMFMVYSSIFRNSTEVVRAMVGLAPGVFMTDIRSPVRYLAPLATVVEWSAQNLGLNEFLPSNNLLSHLQTMFCEANRFDAILCRKFIFFIVGFDEELFDMDLLPSLVAHTPSGASTKTFVHISQSAVHKGFQEYDYGPNMNIKHYGTIHSPSYNLTEIKVPMFLASGLNDWLVGPKSVSDLTARLKNEYIHFVVPFEKFNHFDFLLAKNVEKLLYEPVIKYMGNFR